MSNENARMSGIVDSYNPKRGFGFIKGTDGKVYFVYQGQIKKEGFRKLRRGEAVNFIPSEVEGKTNEAALDVVSEAASN